MEIETARKWLEVAGDFTKETVQSAYLDRVKNVRGRSDFEAILKELNVARDTLNGELNSSHELVSVLGRRLTEIASKQTAIVVAQEAKQQISDTLSSLGRSEAIRFRGARDVTAILSAVSGVLAFGKENLAQIAPQLASNHTFGQILLISCAVFAAMAYGANRNATKAIEQTDALNHELTRARQINRILDQLFHSGETIVERDLQRKLRECVLAVTGMPHGSRSLDRVLDLYSSLGVPVRRRVNVREIFFEDYADFLIKSGYIELTRSPEGNTLVRRGNNGRN